MNTTLENIIERFERVEIILPNDLVKTSSIIEILKTYLEEEKEMIMQCGTSGAIRFSQYYNHLNYGEIGEEVYEQLKKY